MGDARAATVAQATHLRQQAREEKRKAQRHRRRARLLMERADALERAGIHIPPTQPQEAQS